MPLGKRTKSYDQKRNVRQRTIGPQRPMSRSMLTPTLLKRKLRYFGQATLNPGAAGLAANHVVAANDLYDPDVTGTGHQPTGFDEYMTFYTHFKVVKSKITFWAANTNDSTTTNQCIITCSLKSVVTSNTDIAREIENGAVSFGVLQTGTGANVKKLTKSFDLGRWLPNQKYDQRVMGTDSGSPSEQAYFHLSAASLNSGGDAASFNICYVVDYDVEFTEKKNVSVS